MDRQVERELVEPAGEVHDEAIPSSALPETEETQPTCDKVSNLQGQQQNSTFRNRPRSAEDSKCSSRDEASLAQMYRPGSHLKKAASANAASLLAWGDGNNHSTSSGHGIFDKEGNALQTEKSTVSSLGDFREPGESNESNKEQDRKIARSKRTIIRSGSQVASMPPRKSSSSENLKPAKTSGKAPPSYKMKRLTGVSPFIRCIQEEVLAQSGLRSSAAFPIEVGRVGPGSFHKVKILGQGAAGTVFLVMLKGTDKLYAMKELTKEDMIKRKKVMRVMTEREILASAHHPFIVTMYATFQTSRRLCFVMEYCSGGEFFGVLSRQPQNRLAEDTARFYAAEVLLALEYLHHLGFFYRDLKPENILMRGDGHIALADFDLSKQAQAVSPRMIQHQLSAIQKISNIVVPKSKSSRLCDFEIVDSEPILDGGTNSFVGTVEYLAPELVNGMEQTSAVDWWTLGILIYEMMTGTTPFRAQTLEEIMANITDAQKISWPTDVPVSHDARKLVKGLLKKKANKRLGSQNGASDIKAARWFAKTNFALIRNETPPILPNEGKASDLSSLVGENKKGLEEVEDSPGVDSNLENDKLFAQFDIQRLHVTGY